MAGISIEYRKHLITGGGMENPEFRQYGKRKFKEELKPEEVEKYNLPAGIPFGTSRKSSENIIIL